MATSPPTGTVTFLFTDIEGSTKRWENNAPAMQTASASTAAVQGEAERAARLYGVVEKLNEVMGTPQDAGENALTGPYLAAARSQLDEASWQEAWAQGRAMTLEDAVAYALEEDGASG